MISKETHYDDTGGLAARLADHPAVDSAGLYKEGDDLLSILSTYKYINTIYIDPYTLGFEATFEFISFLRDKHNDYRRICIVLLNRNREGESLNEFLEKYPCKKHYFKLDYNYDVPDTEAAHRLDESIVECHEDWFKKLYQYELAISYCSADRTIVAPIVNLLNDKIATEKIFYDADKQADLVGHDLENQLPGIYGIKSRYCAMFVSKEYINRMWPLLERKTALLRNEKEPGFIIPISIDGAAIPEHTLITGDENNITGSKIVYYDISEGAENIVSMILGKIWVMKPKSFNFFTET